MKKGVFLLAFAAISVSTSAYAFQMPLSINESVVIKENDLRMLGSNFEWEEQFEAFINSDLSVNVSLAEAAGQYPLPGSRMAGSSSRVFQWKKAVGPYGDRPLQNNGYANVRMRYGVLEWINHVKTVNPDAMLTYVLNMETGTASDAADLAEFLLGDGSVNYNGFTNWAEKRKQYGVEEPVHIDIWELGNEVDMATALGPTGMSKEEYVNSAKAYISAIKAIDPDAVFAACGHTLTGSLDDGESQKAQEWNQYVLEQLGSSIDYLTVHLYYTQYDMTDRENKYMDKLRDMVNEICPSVKLYYSEHSTYIRDFSDPEVVERTHGMYGTLATSEFYNRVMIRPEVGAANYHCYYSPNWSEFYKDAGGILKPTPIALMMKIYADYSIGNVVSSTLTGYKEGREVGVTDLVIEQDGMLNIIITNQTADSVEIMFETQKNYIMTERSEIYADMTVSDPEYADNWYDKDLGIEKNEVLYNKDTYARNEICSNFEVKPYSVTAVRLKSAEPKKSTIYVARYAEDGTLIGLRVIPDYLFTTDTRAITDAALRYGEKAYVWDDDMKPLAIPLSVDMIVNGKDNDFADIWDN